MALLAVLALTAPGCATSDKELHRELLAERLETMTIVTRADLAEQPKGSPARTVLLLWRAVQFRNPEDALPRVSPQPTKRQLQGLYAFIVGDGAQAASTIKPRIVGAKRLADRASVTIELIRHKKVGDQVRSAVAGRLDVPLERTDTGWVVLWRQVVDDLLAAMR
jgi:hypothetical protein